MTCRHRPPRPTKQQAEHAYWIALHLARDKGCGCEPDAGPVRHVRERSGYIYALATLHHERGCALCRA